MIPALLTLGVLCWYSWHAKEAATRRLQRLKAHADLQRDAAYRDQWPKKSDEEWIWMRPTPCTFDDRPMTTFTFNRYSDL